MQITERSALKFQNSGIFSYDYISDGILMNLSQYLNFIILGTHLYLENHFPQQGMSLMSY